MEENKKSKAEEIADMLGFKSINSSNDDFIEGDDKLSPFLSGAQYSAVRNYLNVFSKGENALAWPIDSRLIATENEKIKPLDKLSIRGKILKLRTVLIFENKADEIINYEYDCINNSLILKSQVFNYFGDNYLTFEEYSLFNSDNKLPFFEKLKHIYGPELSKYKIEHDKEAFLNIFNELQQQDKCKIFRFKDNHLNLNKPEHRMLFVEKFLSFDFSPIHWQIFLNFPLGLSNKFRESFQFYEDGLITRNEAYNQCVNYLDNYLMVEFQ